MRKLCLLLCCVLIFQLFVGCSSRKEEFEEPVNFYYINKEISYNTTAGVISAEVREGAQYHQLEDLLRAYLNGPKSSELQNYIPVNVSLLSCKVENDIAYILFSPQFAELSGVKLMTACSALVLTIHDYNGAQEVCIRAENAQLDDRDDLLLSINDIVLMDMVTVEESKE